MLFRSGEATPGDDDPGGGGEVQGRRGERDGEGLLPIQIGGEGDISGGVGVLSVGSGGEEWIR